ncbi:MAG TPA: hypothetical protein DCL29_05820 [Eubacterium sp.]|nr:hypothetical protein [Eubacterium sp.]
MKGKTMTKLDELMELNKSIDVIINSAMEENKKIEAEIAATKIELWNRMWGDIEAWYRKGYIDVIKDNGLILEIPYGYYDRTIWTYNIKLYKHFYKTPCVYLDISGGHTEIKRCYSSMINDTSWSKYITALLLNWGKTKDKIEQELTDLVAKSIKEKTKKTEDKINYINSLAEALKNISEEKDK